MKNLSMYLFVLLVVAASWAAVSPSAWGSIFINEIHYDNDGTDVNEGIEIAGPAGIDLSKWSVKLYNGSNGTIYDTFDLSGNTIPNQQNGFGTLFCSIPSMQNGTEGMALVDNSDNIVQFLSYEGSLTATEGPAFGLSSLDILVSEASSPLDFSLQLTGSGRAYDDFTWSGPIAHTRGEINAGQSFVPIPGGVWLLGSGLIGLLGIRNRKKRVHS